MHLVEQGWQFLYFINDDEPVGGLEALADEFGRCAQLTKGICLKQVIEFCLWEKGVEQRTFAVWRGPKRKSELCFRSFDSSIVRENMQILCRFL